jgi:hypothetical protein
MATQDQQLQQIVDKTIMEADQDGDGKLSFEEFAQMVSNTVRVASLRNYSQNLCHRAGHCETDDTGGSFLMYL